MTPIWAATALALLKTSSRQRRNIATTIPGTGVTRRGPGRSMTIMGLRSEHSAPAKPGPFSTACTAPNRTPRLPVKKPRCWAALSMFRGTALAHLRWVRLTLRLVLDLGIANDFTGGGSRSGDGLLRPRHSGLPSVFAALILLSLKVMFVRHGQLLSERILIIERTFSRGSRP